MTVRHWIKLGKIHALRVCNEARILAMEVPRLLGEFPKSVVVLYERVSGHDHQSQMEALRTWAKRQQPGWEIVELSDIGSGRKRGSQAVA